MLNFPLIIIPGQKPDARFVPQKELKSILNPGSGCRKE